MVSAVHADAMAQAFTQVIVTVLKHCTMCVCASPEVCLQVCVVIHEYGMVRVLLGPAGQAQDVVASKLALVLERHVDQHRHAIAAQGMNGHDSGAGSSTGQQRGQGCPLIHH